MAEESEALTGMEGEGSDNIDARLAGFDDPSGSSMLARLGRWMRSVRPWQSLSLLVLICVPLTFILLTMWIGLTFLLGRGPGHTVSAEASLNLLLVCLVAGPGFVLMHHGQYRWFRQADRDRSRPRSGLDASLPTGEEVGREMPKIAWSRGAHLRHGLMYLAAMTILVITFAPYQHQVRIASFLDRFSAGSASHGTLSGIAFLHAPMALFCVFAILVTHRQMKRRDAGGLDATRTIELDAEVNWLFAFAATFGTAAFLCHFAGSMIHGTMP